MEYNSHDREAQSWGGQCWNKYTRPTAAVFPLSWTFLGGHVLFWPETSTLYDKMCRYQKHSLGTSLSVDHDVRLVDPALVSPLVTWRHSYRMPATGWLLVKDRSQVPLLPFSRVFMISSTTWGDQEAEGSVPAYLSVGIWKYLYILPSTYKHNNIQHKQM